MNTPVLERFPELPTVIRQMSRKNMLFCDIYAALQQQPRYTSLTEEAIRRVILRTKIIVKKNNLNFAPIRSAPGRPAAPSRNALRMAARQAKLEISEAIAAAQAESPQLKPYSDNP
jgi:hypothetical protein